MSWEFAPKHKIFSSSLLPLSMERGVSCTRARRVSMLSKRETEGARAMLIEHSSLISWVFFLLSFTQREILDFFSTFRARCVLDWEVFLFSLNSFIFGTSTVRTTRIVCTTERARERRGRAKQRHKRERWKGFVSYLTAFKTIAALDSVIYIQI